MQGQVFFLFFLLASATAQAAVQFDGTRVIYPAAKREVTLALTNNASGPRLLQAWMDDGNPDLRPETGKVPFIVTPPVFRLNAEKGQSLRIRFTGGKVPQDRESVWWLNVLEVQPKTERGAKNPNLVHFPVRTRLKVFYRPAGLPGTPGGAVNTLRWRLTREAGAMKIICENPSAFNVSLARISLYATDRPNEEVKGMCPAKGSAAFTLEGTETGKVYFTTISDYGGFARHSAVYTG